MNPRRIWADFVIFSRGYLRNRAALFFSLVFPIMLIGLFGLIFSQAGNTAIPVAVVNLDHGSNASAQFLSDLVNTGAIAPTDVSGSLSPGENLSTYLGNHSDRFTVGLVIPAGFSANYQNHTPIGVVIFVNPQDPSSSGLLEGSVQGVVAEFNLKAAHGTPIVYATTYKVGSPVYKYIDYLVPGLIGFAILTSPMFSMVDISSTYRKEGLFRQLSLTPLTKGEWLTAKILWYIVLTFISAALMLTFGVIVFHAHFTLTLQLLPFLILGPFFFVSLGMLAGSVARTPESAAIIGNVITFPMMFLSGTFFPVTGFPPALQAFAHILPLYYIIDGMNQVMLLGNLARAATDLVIILIGSVIVFIAAITLFKWRDN